MAAMWGYFYFKNNSFSALTTSKVTPTINLTVSIYPSITPTPSVSKTSDEDLIKQSFAQKYNKKISEISLDINKKDDTHVWGSVKFSGEMSGGWFLAFKEFPDNWIIVQDGNGTISCEAIKPYSFPISMVSGCVDQNGKLIKL